jgi:glucose/arabinose dehydrogenase
MDAGLDAQDDVARLPLPDGSVMDPCSLPGSIQFTANGTVVVPGGGASWPSLAFLHLPAGFCAHYYGTVGNARQLRFAPGGDLFVASPTALSTGGGQGGLSAYVVLRDANQDGVGDGINTFLSFPTKSMNQGMLFANGFFYYQNGVQPGTQIMRVPYAAGDLTPSGASEVVADIASITNYTSTLHWPKTLDMADDGTIYVGNGGDQSETCVSPHPFHGGIVSIPSTPAPDGGVQGTEVAKGLRNPIAVRCAQGHNRCFALELAKDYTYNAGGREKIIPIHQGDDWGFPCCATFNLPYQGTPAGTDCSGVAQESNGFYIGDTPFGLDFEGGYWPEPWLGQAFVATHGAAGSWVGARLVAIPMDRTTGLPESSSNANTNRTNMGMTDFATGWDDGTLTHGRPSAVAFSPDGRLFVANDNNGVIFWIAPIM